MSFFYKELDLPSIPDELIANMVAPEKKLSTHNSAYGLNHQNKNIPLHPCGYYFGKVVDEPLLNWLKENIPQIAKHLTNPRVELPGVYVQTQTNTNKKQMATHIVHTDVRRVAALNYHWDLGGSHVINRWYQEQGQPLLRPKTNPGVQTDTGAVYYKDLKILDEIKTTAPRWYMLNTAVLHDVQNIKSTRQGLTVCFGTAEELDFAGFTEHP